VKPAHDDFGMPAEEHDAVTEPTPAARERWENIRAMAIGAIVVTIVIVSSAVLSLTERVPAGDQVAAPQTPVGIVVVAEATLPPAPPVAATPAPPVVEAPAGQARQSRPTPEPGETLPPVPDRSAVVVDVPPSAE
jgi:hypothetical protein